MKIAWGAQGLYVAGSTALVKVIKSEHYEQHPLEEIITKQSFIEKVYCVENLLVTQVGDRLSVWREKEKQKIEEFEFSKLNAWTVCTDFTVGVGSDSQVCVFGIGKKLPKEEEVENNPFLCNVIGQEEEKEVRVVQSQQERSEKEETEILRPKRSFNNSADMIRADLLEREEILCYKKEGLLIRTVTLQTDIVELHFRDDARKSLNTKLVNEHSCGLGCFSLKGIMLVKNADTETILLYRKLREASLFVSNWETQFPYKVDCLAMTQKYNVCGTENGEVHLFSLNGLKLGSLHFYKLVVTIAANELTLAVLYSSLDPEIKRRAQKKKSETLQLKLYSYDSFGQFTPQARSIQIPEAQDCPVKWVGFMEKMSISDEGQGQLEDREQPLVLLENGALLVYTQSEVWLEIRQFDRLTERVLLVELDSILAYDVRYPFEEKEMNFSSQAEEQGGLGGLLMLKNCMGLLVEELNQEQIKSSTTLTLLNTEYEKKVMKGLKVAISDKNMGLALDYAHLMMTKSGLTLASRMAQKLKQEELAERIETIAMERAEGRRIRPPQTRVLNPLKALLDDHQGLDVNNIRLKYGAGMKNSLSEEARSYHDFEGEAKKGELDSELGGIGQDQGYSGSSFSFQLSKDTEEILQMQKTEETKKENTIASEEQHPPNGQKVNKAVFQTQSKLFGKARPGSKAGQKPSFMDALKANSFNPKKRAKKI